MKKILFACLFATSAFGLQSCNNGDYDVNPATTASGTNPLNTGGTGGSGGGNGGGSGPGTAAKGEIRFTLNGGDNITYSGGGTNYIEIGTDTRLLSGGASGTTGRTVINLRIEGYTGTATYALTGTTSASSRGVYTIQPFTGSADEYNTATSSTAGSGQVIVTSDANNELIGTFSFTAYSTTTPANKVTITNGSFDLPKM